MSTSYYWKQILPFYQWKNGMTKLLVVITTEIWGIKKSQLNIENHMLGLIYNEWYQPDMNITWPHDDNYCYIIIAKENWNLIFFK